MTDHRSPSERAVRIRRLLPATPEEVFEAWTDAESLRQWLCPGTTTVETAELDVRVGGKFSIVLHTVNGLYAHTGEYREIRRPERLVFTWRSNFTHDEETLVTVELFPQGEETEMLLTHELLLDEDQPRHATGWQSVEEKLEDHLRSKAKPPATH